jgi:ribosomal protein S18 acetylase RimI-like enzyme
MEIRPYNQSEDKTHLWDLKQAFETELATGTGGKKKQAAYDAKLTEGYQKRYFGWVERCVSDESRCMMLAVDEDSEPVGYVFVLPERLAMIWDAAVVNELYVSPEYRGTGVADELMGLAYTLAREQDLPLKRLVLDVDPENDRARAFYNRHGFKPWGEMVAKQL